MNFSQSLGYEENRTKAIELLERMLKNLQEDRQATDLQKINRGYVGTMASYVEGLQKVSDSMFHEGEHSPERNRY
jgi:polyhydroxyalkanoate synthesis regulator phasin